MLKFLIAYSYGLCIMHKHKTYCLEQLISGHEIGADNSGYGTTYTIAS